MFRFSQIEVPWPVGPPDGRYLVRSADGGPDSPPTHVLVIDTLGAVRRPRLARASRRADPEPEPTPVTTGRATLVTAERLPDEAAADAWLSQAGEADFEHDLGVIGRALHAFRLVTADPHRHAVSRGQLLVARIGYGEGEQVADGRWSRALELSPPAPRRQRRAKVLEPQARLAAALAGREPALLCEDLALRAQLDLEQDRPRAAALQVLISLDAAIAELAGEDSGAGIGDRVAELRALRPGVVAAAQAALSHDLDAEAHRTVEAGLSRIEAALRARAVSRA